MFRVRPAQPSDVDAVLSLVQRFHEKAKPPYSVQRTIQSMKTDDILWVAEQDDVLRGYVWMTTRGAREVFIEQIYGDEEIVDAFEAALIPRLRDAGFAIISTLAIREGWWKMFTRWGFRPVGVLLERTLDSRELKRLPVLEE